MAFIERIKALFPDKYIKADIKKGKKGDSTIQLAKLAHVNALGEQAEAGLQLVSDRIITSNAGSTLPSKVLSKTGTKITYGDGTVQEGWKLTLIGTLQGNSNELTEITTVNIPDDGSGSTEGYYLPWEMKGVVAFTDAAISQNVINVLQNGAELADTLAGTGRAADSMAILESTTDADVDFTLSVVANPSGVGAFAEGVVTFHFEFLCYEGVVPTII